jgi:hypothetical protein
MNEPRTIIRTETPELYGLPPYPKGEVVGPCVCGSWPGGECLQCAVSIPVPTAKGASDAQP